MRTNKQQKEKQEEPQDDIPIRFTMSQMFGALGVLVSIVTVWGALQGKVNLLDDRDRMREEAVREVKDSINALKLQVDTLEKRVFVLEQQARPPNTNTKSDAN